MQLSPLRLEDSLLKEVRFSLTGLLAEPPDSAVKYDLMDVEVASDTKMRGDDPLAWRCELTVKSKEVPEAIYPYSFIFVYVGFFRVVKEFPAERIPQMVRTNAPAVLYSAAREAVLYLTGRGRYPAVLLPSITFLEPPSPSATVAASKTHHKKTVKKVARKK